MLEFKEQEGGGFYVVERHKDDTITTFGIIRKSESSSSGNYVFDPTNFTYNADELQSISEFMKGLV